MNGVTTGTNHSYKMKLLHLQGEEQRPIQILNEGKLNVNGQAPLVDES